ncbi:glycosyltransferase [Streptococcus infantarius subsp. infantarius]|uniref:glycosyltransferase family 2 protein n=1 Tax=Streptococcus infantarius TaxID=102684 RepID=UPI001BDAE244|nr:glycosyltransferase [Streptococcus infantarius]MBT0897399.1 glycosyltransferase [Streptococcus infantarius subsp. infantarius]MBT0901021.1 glycosyltransferase [Streptococcus infantarius subsp. infantarius]MBT1034604.1 glycosyltransferase [Streptococcus infantarius subsp. infantarius]MCO4587066.1 Glycosyl transferases involved in cell wall biogenesis [Streptococcus infantarius subsp. infantarius]MCO4650963.1 Glycosyl transferases involved in cell wall biogenesis [Streptococcus infantarius su
MKYSVIIPVYNVEKYIDRCLKSIISQNYDDLEIIVVDNGSTDSSGSICDTYANEHSNISVYHIENHGVGSARNFGLSKARGEFIYFVDSDDYLVGNLFAEFEDKLTPDLDLLVFSYYNSFEQEMTEKTRTKNILPYNDSYDKYDFSKIFKDLFLSDILYTVWNKIYRREFLLENNFSFEQYELGEDVRFNLDVYREVNKIYLSQDSYYVYVTGRKGSAMSGYNPKRLQYQLQELKLVDSLLKDWHIDSSNLDNAVKARILMSNIYNISKQKLPVTNKVKLVKEICKNKDMADFIRNDSSLLNPLIKMLLKCRMYIVLIYLKTTQMLLQHL